MLWTFDILRPLEISKGFDHIKLYMTESYAAV